MKPCRSLCRINCSSAVAMLNQPVVPGWLPCIQHAAPRPVALPAQRHMHTQHQVQHSVVNAPARCQAVPVPEVQLLADAPGVQLLLPGLAVVLAGAAALKFSLYSQLEVITAKMLSKYVPSGGTGARVIQLGGGTRELYYYPADVVLVTNVGEQVNKGLMEQAGVTAAVPTRVRQQPITDLRFQPDSSVDAVVALGVLGQLGGQQLPQCLQEVCRVLKPGAPLVFIEPLAEGGSPIREIIGLSVGKQRLASAELASWQQNPSFSYIQWDTALQWDPHAVGVAVRSERAVGVAESDSAAVRRRRKQSKAAKGFSSSGTSS